MSKQSIHIGKSIVLIGFMGVGKTSIGKALAEQMSRPFIDIDLEIEETFDMATTAIFDTYGEAVFRNKEKELINQHCQTPGRVISLGGGAFLQEEVKQQCMENALVIFLEMGWDAWQERIPEIIDTRPILQNKSIEEIKALYEARQQVYADYHIRVNVDTLQIDEAEQNIIKSLHQLTN